MTVHKLMIVAGGLIIVGAITLVAWLLLRPQGESAVTPEPADPFAPTLGGDAEGPGDTFSIILADGSTATVPDFRDEQPAWASAESGYLVAGGDAELYQILYFEDGSGFLVSIQSEPLKDARFQAEGELRETLRLTDAELCKLSVEVAVAQSVNQVYAGQNLGLSFCPGSVVLP